MTLLVGGIHVVSMFMRRSPDRGASSAINSQNRTAADACPSRPKGESEDPGICPIAKDLSHVSILLISMPSKAVKLASEEISGLAAW